MNTKQVKVLRGQIRQIIQELLPSVIEREAFLDMHKTLSTTIDRRLDNLTDMVKAKLEQVDQRSKDMQAHVLKNVGVPSALGTEAPTEGGSSKA